MTGKIKYSIICFVFFTGVVFLLGPAHAGSSKDMGGWGIDDAYNKLYDAGGVEKLKAVVEDILEVVPMKGMSPAAALMIKESPEDDPILVHLCPAWYKKPSRIGLRKGDKIRIRGYFTEINGEEVLMAAKVKYNDKEFKVRLTSDGTPFWTMSPAQLQKELSSN